MPYSSSLIFQQNHRNSKGFTLVELVIVTILVGILAITALPKFVNRERDARIAVLHNIAGQMKTVSELAHHKALFTSQSAPFVANFLINSRQVRLVYG